MAHRMIRAGLLLVMLAMSACTSSFDMQLARAADHHRFGLEQGKDYFVQRVPQNIIDIWEPGRAAAAFNGAGSIKPIMVLWSEDVAFNVCLFDHELWHTLPDPTRPGKNRDHDANGKWYDTGEIEPCMRKTDGAPERAGIQEAGATKAGP